MTTGTPGTLISGTLRTEDLLQAFADELKRLATDSDHLALATEALSINSEDENASELVTDLSDALTEYALPYFYFGAHCGDGADFGFWPCESLEDAIHDGSVAKISDPSDLDSVPADVGEAYHVNDHGNATLYARTNDGWREVWALV